MIKQFCKHIVRAYLRLLVLIVIKRYHPDIIAISGVTNKSTVKRLIAARLTAKGKVVRITPRNLNTTFGLPLAVMAIEPQGWSASTWLRTLLLATKTTLFNHGFPPLLVLEFGVSEQGDMKQLLRIIRPRAAVLTNAIPSYYNPNATLDELTSEITQLVEALPRDGFLVYNADDERLVSIAHNYTGLKLSYGIGERAEVRATNIMRIADGLQWHSNGSVYKSPQVGEHHIYALEATLATEQCLLNDTTLPLNTN